MSELPDYYAILEVSPTGSADDIKRAYKKAALKWHPDRVPTDSPERPKRTKMFQRINDAYYVLSDTTRRKDYDEARKFHGTSFDDFDYEDEGEETAEEEIPRTNNKPSGGFASWANMFGFGKSGATQDNKDSQESRFANDQFGSVFEEMMGEDGMAAEEDGKKVPTKRFWSVAGGIAGAVIGFIMADVVGAIPGAMAGAKAGAIRDAKGKSVYAVFQSLEQDQKARILSELAAKLFSGAIS
ncbi:putative J domain-containing protein C63.13 [Exophiala dermatitidis]